MGHNRAGVDRKARLKRRKKEMERLAKKQPAPAKGAAAKASLTAPPASAQPAG